MDTGYICSEGGLMEYGYFEKAVNYQALQVIPGIFMRIFRRRPPKKRNYARPLFTSAKKGRACIINIL